MRPGDRIITRLPLKELFDDNGPVEAVRQRELNAHDIRELLQAGPLRFVVANCGAKPTWIAGPERFEFWKSEVLPHLADPKEGADLESFPGGYCYFASEWRCPDGSPVVLLEMVH
jgi:hypothetical protein